MKKIVSVLLCLVVTCSLIAVAAISASAEGVLALGASATSVKVGEQTTITVSLSGTTANQDTAGSVQLTLDNKVTLVSGEWLKTGGKLSGFNKTKLNGAIAFDTPTDFNGDYFRFVVEGANVGKSTISVTVTLRAGTTVHENLTQTIDVTVECATHTWSDWSETTPAGCTTKAVESHTCTVCGATETRDGDGPTGHSFTNYVSDNNATCLVDGTKTAKCDNCDATDTITDVGSAPGHHSFTNYVSDNNATCLVDGTKTAKCDNCDETDTITDVGSAPGHHSFTNYVSDNNATCLVDGTKTAKCDNCDATDTITDVGSAPGHHSFTNYVSDNNATCTEDGTKTAKCDKCDATDTIADKGSATGHKLTKVEAKAATATEAGNTEYYTCSGCNKWFADEAGTQEITDHNSVVIPATGSSQGNENQGNTQGNENQGNTQGNENQGNTQGNENQGNTQGNQNQGNNGQSGNSPKTGDASVATLWIALLTLSVAAFGAVLALRKKVW